MCSVLRQQGRLRKSQPIDTVNVTLADVGLDPDFPSYLPLLPWPTTIGERKNVMTGGFCTYCLKTGLHLPGSLAEFGSELDERERYHALRRGLPVDQAAAVPKEERVTSQVTAPAIPSPVFEPTVAPAAKKDVDAFDMQFDDLDWDFDLPLDDLMKND